MGILAKELKKLDRLAKKDKQSSKIKRKLRPFFYTFDTLDGGKIDKVRTRRYRTTSF